MKTLLNTALFIIFFSICANAQVKVGFKAEYGFALQNEESMFILKERNFISHKISIGSIGNTTSFGVLYQFQFGWMFLQPELFYTKHSNEYLVTGFTPENSPIAKTYSETYQNVEFHCAAGFNFNNVKVSFGPAFNYTLQLDSEMADLQQMNVNENYFGGGFFGGIGYEWKNVQLDIKYLNQFYSISQHLDFEYQDFDLETTLRSVRVGLAFTIPTK